MMFKHGELCNDKGKVKDIIVKADVNSFKESLIGCIIIGLGMSYLTRNAFKRGVKAFEEAEYKTMVDLGIIEK